MEQQHHALGAERRVYFPFAAAGHHTVDAVNPAAIKRMQPYFGGNRFVHDLQVPLHFHLHGANNSDHAISPSFLSAGFPVFVKISIADLSPPHKAENLLANAGQPFPLQHLQPALAADGWAQK